MDMYYEDRRELCMVIADVLRDQVASVETDVVQVDEAHLPGYPEDAELAAEAINRVLEGVQGERAVHLCFGNYAGQATWKDTYERMMPAFDALKADYLVLGLTQHDYKELEVLRDLDSRMSIGLGVIDIKDNAVESANEVARRIERAEQTLGEERIQYVHPDCGFYMLPRSVADSKMRSLVPRRDLFLGDENTVGRPEGRTVGEPG